MSSIVKKVPKKISSVLLCTPILSILLPLAIAINETKTKLTFLKSNKFSFDLKDEEIVSNSSNRKMIKEKNLFNLNKTKLNKKRRLDNNLSLNFITIGKDNDDSDLMVVKNEKGDLFFETYYTDSDISYRKFYALNNNGRNYFYDENSNNLKAYKTLAVDRKNSKSWSQNIFIMTNDNNDYLISNSINSNSFELYDFEENNVLYDTSKTLFSKIIRSDRFSLIKLKYSEENKHYYLLAYISDIDDTYYFFYLSL